MPIICCPSDPAPSPQVAERSGHSVEVLLRIYAKCIDGGDKVANMHIDAARRDF